MPFKIVHTYNEQQNKQELCICPSKWEKHGVLDGPNKKSKKICKIENSTPQPNWTKIHCIVIRNNIMSYEIADMQLTEMLDCSTTKQEATEPLPALSPHLIGPTNQLDFNIIAQPAPIFRIIIEHDYLDKFTFLCEMYDAETDHIVELILYFFPFDNSCQILNAKEGKTLLKRIQVPSLKLEMLQIGNIINVFSKLLRITDCAPATRQKLFNHFESTFALIKPVPADMHGKIIAFITKKGFRIVRMKNCKLSKDFAVTLYEHMAGNKLVPIVINYITGGEVIGLELVGPNAVSEWRHWLGATDPADAAPGTLRQMYGTDILQNVAHGCHSQDEAVKMLALFFGRNKENVPLFPFRATFKDCTCCVIKPHAILDGNLGLILEQISSSGKFVISAMAMFSVNMTNAKEFYEVYDGVVPEYTSACIHLAEGKCIALEVKCIDPSLNCVCEFRKLCGPRDPDLCRQLYPGTLRALYGKDIVHNAVHCTDLPEDGEFEVEYFFKLIAYE